MVDVVVRRGGDHRQGVGIAVGKDGPTANRLVDGERTGALTGLRIRAGGQESREHGPAREACEHVERGCTGGQGVNTSWELISVAPRVRDPAAMYSLPS